MKAYAYDLFLNKIYFQLFVSCVILDYKEMKFSFPCFFLSISQEVLEVLKVKKSANTSLLSVPDQWRQVFKSYILFIPVQKQSRLNRFQGVFDKSKPRTKRNNSEF